MLTIPWLVAVKTVYIDGTSFTVSISVDKMTVLCCFDLLQILNYNYLYAINAWLLLNPTWLCFDWSMGCVPVITSLADIRLLAVVALWIFVVLFHFGVVCCLPGHDQR